MTTVVIIGGKLQGTEAAYLAQKAGYRTILVDRQTDVPARGLCDEFIKADVRSADDREKLLPVLRAADFVLPATENRTTLACLRPLAARPGITLAFDFDAFGLAASKKRSDTLFHQNGIPAPASWPAGAGPFIAKPAGGSGSKGVRRLETPQEAKAFLAGCEDPEAWVVQEYLPGRAYSIEVIGRPGAYRSYQVTEIHTDAGHDCSRVSCPCPELGAGLGARFSAVAVRLAQLVGLHGIMDVEAIHHGDDLKVLEIDARLPSQTPTAVYHSTGINLLAELHRLYCAPNQWTGGPAPLPTEWPTAYEHLEVRYIGPGTEILEVGEGKMAECGPLTLYENTFGSRELLTDYKPGAPLLRTTLINREADPAALEKRRGVARAALVALGKK